MDNKLSENEEKVLAYLQSKEKNTGFMGADRNEILIFLGVSQASTQRILTQLKEKKLLLLKQEGKKTKFLITTDGREYLKFNSVSPIPAEEVKSFTYEESREVRETLDEIAVMKNELEVIKNEYEKRLVKIETDLNEKISSFYGRIGEILALIITAVAMIVFNIQLVGNIEIDFKEPMKATQTILAIDLPYIVLFTIMLFIFHIIIGKGENKDIKGKDIKNIVVKSLPIILIIIICMLFIA